MERLIKTNSDFKLLGTSEVFPKGIYVAEDATNQPDWEGYGKVFIYNDNGCDLLLDENDYADYAPDGEKFAR